MINHLRFLWKLLVTSSLLVIIGISLIIFVPIDLPLINFLLTVVILTIISMGTYVIMSKGIEKSSKEGLVFLLGGIGMKFILYLAFILVYWAITKNLSKPFIIAFFLLYLIFTFLMMTSLYKRLKIK